MPRYPFSEWAAEQLRLTVFLLPGADNLPAEQWWEGVIGAAADESTANQRLGLKVLASAFHGGKLVLKLEPGRIDWLFAPQDPDPAAGPPVELPSIGPVTETLELFSDIARRWLGRTDIPDLVRIAFGIVVKHPEPDRRSGYARLSEYLPIRVAPDSTDFFFQINVPADTRTGIEGLQINRLSKWSIMAFGRVQFKVEGAKVTASPSQLLDHAMRLELDMNTSPEFRGPVPRERLVDVYHELVALGREIVIEGLPR